MPWKSMKDVPPNIKAMGVSLSQANKIAEIAEAAGEGDTEAWGIGISQFKKMYVKRGSKWVKREKTIESVHKVLKHLAGRHSQRTHGNRFGSSSAVKRTLRNLANDPEARQTYRAKVRKQNVEAKATPVKATYSAVGPGDRYNANVADLAADYKARGIDRQAAYGQLVKDKNFNPGLDNKEFQKVWDTVEPKALQSSKTVTGDVMELEETFGTPKRKVIVTEETEHSVSWIDENGMMGGTPKTMIKKLTPVTEKPAEVKTNVGRTRRQDYAKMSSVELHQEFNSAKTAKDRALIANNMLNRGNELARQADNIVAESKSEVKTLPRLDDTLASQRDRTMAISANGKTAVYIDDRGIPQVGKIAYDSNGQAWASPLGNLQKVTPEYVGKVRQVESSVPKVNDMSKWTPSQHTNAINKLSNLKVADLRKRQDLVAAQKKLAFEQYEKTTSPEERERLERGMQNLNIQEAHLTQAIMRVEFGTE